MRWLINGYTSDRTPLASYLEERSLLDISVRAFTEPKKKKTSSYVGGADRHDPAEAGWVLVVPDDEEGRSIADQLAPLIEHRLRVREKGREAVRDKAVLFFPASAREPTALAKFVDKYLGYGPLGEDPPFFVLVAGPPGKIPFALEQILSAGEQCAGRLCFDSVTDYGVYARKVIAWEPDDDFARTPRSGLPVGVFATDHGADDATHASAQYLVKPFLDKLREDPSRAVVAKQSDDATAAALSALLRGEDGALGGPRLLFSATHGLAVKGKGDAKRAERLGRQGAIYCQNAVSLGDEEIVDARSLASGPALAGGFWMMFACFGAGTPAASEFMRVLGDPSFLGFHEGGPFVSALPKQLLANEDGPLAVVGHLDPSFVHAFSDPEGIGGERSNAIYSVLKRLLDGYRVGIAASHLAAAGNRYDKILGEVDKDLAITLGSGLRQADAVQVATALANAEPGDPLASIRDKLVDYSVSRYDFKNFVVLGDPAAKLPRKGATRSGSRNAVFSIPQEPSSGSAPTPVESTTQAAHASGTVKFDAEAKPLCFNGVDVTTGDYLLPSLSIDQIARVASGERLDEATLGKLRSVTNRATKKSFGPSEGIDPKDLASAGWGVVFASENAAKNQAIRDALGELLALRKEQAGDFYFEFIDGGEKGRRAIQSGESAHDFLKAHGVGPGPANPENGVPYYLLLVGDPESISYRFQYELDVQYAVGRLHFETVEEYASYARSVVRAERGEAALNPRASFFAARSKGDAATEMALRLLLSPLAAYLQKWSAEKRPGQLAWEIETIVDGEAKKQRLAEILGAEKPPAFLFTTSHGAGFPMGHERQLAHQGALICSDYEGPFGRGNPVLPKHYFSADDVGDDARLLGMIAFHFACYGAGTPRLDDFSKQAFKVRAEITPRAFVARLPQRLLGHPRGGALAVVGHIERAWSYSFDWPGAGKQTAVFESALRRLVEGHPIGSAFDYFNVRYAELSTMLANEIEAQEGANPDEYKIADLWTANNDARGYAILGDPAVRMPLAQPAKAKPAEEPSALKVDDSAELAAALLDIGEKLTALGLSIQNLGKALAKR